MRNRNIIEQFTDLDGEVDMLAVIAERKRRAKEGKWKQSPGSIYKKYKKDAAKRSKEFVLTLGQFTMIIAEPCHYCGDTGYRGLDRLDSKIGYTRTNVVSCCSMCNLMKQRFSKEAFLKQCQRINSFNQQSTH